MAGMAGMIVEKDYNEENDRLSIFYKWKCYKH